MQYRVRYSVWTVEASSPQEAKKKILDLFASPAAEHLINVEQNFSKTPLWKRVLTGK